MQPKNVERRNTQQYCPTRNAVVVLTVKGNVSGNIVEGEVVSCNRKRKCGAEGFCWLNRQILTSLW